MQDRLAVKIRIFFFFTEIFQGVKTVEQSDKHGRTHGKISFEQDKKIPPSGYLEKLFTSPFKRALSSLFPVVCLLTDLFRDFTWFGIDTVTYLCIVTMYLVHSSLLPYLVNFAHIYLPLNNYIMFYSSIQFYGELFMDIFFCCATMQPQEIIFGSFFCL